MQSKPFKGGEVNLSFQELDGFKHLCHSRGLDYKNYVDPQYVKCEESTVYMIEKYFYPINSMLNLYLATRRFYIIREAVLLLTERLDHWFEENNLNMSLLQETKVSYFRQLMDSIKPAVKNRFSQTKVGFEEAVRLRKLFWMTVYSADRIVFNNDTRAGMYKVHLRNWEEQKERENSFYREQHMKHDIEYLTSVKSLMSNFNKLKNYLWEKVNTGNFKDRLFAYMYLYEFHFKNKNGQSFDKNLTAVNFKHDPQFISINKAYGSNKSFKEQYDQFRDICNNLMYVGYEEFVEDLKGFKVPEIRVEKRKT